MAITGIKEDDPLSGFLFILTIYFILRKVEREGSSRSLTREVFHFILANANDMLLIVRSAEDLQVLQNLINVLAKKIGLAFNPRKCCTLHYSNKPPAECRNTIFNLAGCDISTIQTGHPAMFLEKLIGPFLPRDTVTIEMLKPGALKIMVSKLTPWQSIDYLKTFFFPSLQFLMRTDQIAKTDWSKIDNSLKSLLKRTLGIPPNAANEYLYGSRDYGLLGIPLAADDLDIASIDGGFKLLTSKDPLIKTFAWEELDDTANYRNESTAAVNKELFLNSPPSGRNSNKYKSPYLEPELLRTI